MKKLTLIRHAESAAPRESQTDFDRSLTERGQRQASIMAKRLEKQHFTFDEMYCSGAQRTVSTAQTIYNALSPNQRPIREKSFLYHVNLEHLYRFIETIDNDIEHAVLVSHNPGLSYLLSDLIREPIQHMNTCTVAQLQLNINDWIEIQSNCAQLLSIDAPN